MTQEARIKKREYNFKLARKTKRLQVEYRGGKCTKCSFTNPLSLDFHHRIGTVKDKKVFLRKQCSFNDKVKAELDKCDILCKNCHRVETHGTSGQYDDKKRHLLDWIGGECYICGISNPLCCLDFHHIASNEKEFEIGKRMVGSLDILTPEVEKCIILCANDHRLYHSKDIEVSESRMIHMIDLGNEYQITNSLTSDELRYILETEYDE